MKIKAGYKAVLFLVSSMTAAVLCVLPFLAVEKEVVYIYTDSSIPTSKENGFIKELKRLGVQVILNSKSEPTKGSYGLWFKTPDYAKELVNSPAKENFLYTEAYYPFEWKGLDKLPVILTPYRDLYEHYMRTNIKSAIMNLGVNTADFYNDNAKKKYQIIYYGDNNKVSPIAYALKDNKSAYFLGNFWDKGKRVLPIDTNQANKKGKLLSQSKITVIYNTNTISEDKKIPDNIMEATASGSLVFSTPNTSVQELYQDSVIIYTDEEDFKNKADYYLQLPEKITELTIKAQNITVNKLSSAAAAKRFKEILDWIDKSYKITHND